MHRLVRPLLLLFLLCGFVSATAHAQAASTPGAETFTLGPGDVVRVKIWREKDLDGEYMVDERGDVTLPLLGARSVTGLPWNALRDSLMIAYRKELKAPSVSLIPLRRVYVLGEVTRPGLYLADPTLPLAGIVALAGGASPLGDLRHTRLVRDGKVVVKAAGIEDVGNSIDVRSGDQIVVDQRSWFSRNSTFVASAAISVASLIITLLR
jgi:protein involved in polysaccharide export with SLBB domain